MGVRIHKCLGYGLTDVKAKGYDILDERFNLENGFFVDKDESLFSEEGLIKYLDKEHEIEKNSGNISMISFEILSLKEEMFSLYDLVTFNGEFGLSNVVLFSCPYKDWKRYDDIIDYMEDSEDGQKNKVKILTRSIYPYISWINKDTGKSTFEVDGKNYEYLHMRQAFNMGFDDYDLDKLKEAGFSSMKEADEKIVPKIPEFIIKLCNYLKVFKDDKTIMDLKPMIYTYWS